MASTTGEAGFGEKEIGSSGRIRTYNPSVNSRKAYSRFALQTQDLDVQNPNFPGIWGDFGGTLRRSSGTSFRRDGFTAPIPSQPLLASVGKHLATTRE